MAIHDLVRRGSRLAMQRLHRSGRLPVRVLLIGDGATVFEPQPAGNCAERCADRIWLTTRRGVELDVLTDVAPVLSAVQGAFSTWRLWRYDVVLVLLGEGLDAPRPKTVARAEALLAEVLADTAGSTDVIVLAPQPPTALSGARSRHAAAPEDRLRAAVGREGSGRVRFRSLPGSADSLERCRRWVNVIGEEVARSLDRVALPDAMPAAPLGAPALAAARRQALNGLTTAGASSDPRLDDLVELAKSAFGTDCAEINFLDRDQQWKAAVAGAEPVSGDRTHSFSSLAIQRDAPTVVSDARYDPLFRFSPLVRGPRAIRFYAAHPIESLEGSRIGSFCVYDHVPRDVAGMNLDVLRDLALLAQAEITGADWASLGSESRHV